MHELSIIQKTYDLIKWYVPILERMPKKYKFTLGERMNVEMYDFLEGLILARYGNEKLKQLELLNAKLDILRYQTRLMFDFENFDERKYAYVGERINEIGNELGGWIKQQRQKGT
jgi:hypothetical protein